MEKFGGPRVLLEQRWSSGVKDGFGHEQMCLMISDGLWVHKRSLRTEIELE